MSECRDAKDVIGIEIVVKTSVVTGSELSAWMDGARVVVIRANASEIFILGASGFLVIETVVISSELVPGCE